MWLKGTDLFSYYNLEPINKSVLFLIGQPGHVFNVVNQNGVARFLDGQTGKPANLSNFKTLQLLRTN